MATARGSGQFEEWRKAEGRVKIVIFLESVRGSQIILGEAEWQSLNLYLLDFLQPLLHDI
jgi:hypothetical protein